MCVIFSLVIIGYCIGCFAIACAAVWLFCLLCHLAFCIPAAIILWLVIMVFKLS